MNKLAQDMARSSAENARWFLQDARNSVSLGNVVIAEYSYGQYLKACKNASRWLTIYRGDWAKAEF